jgi:SAM-dependent methyltransferase
MTDGHVAFVGSIPEDYDRHLGSLLFRPYAEDLAARVQVSDGMCILETACGTGIVTEQLLERLGGRSTLVASDLNGAMVAYARGKIGDRPGLEWTEADALSLPYQPASFDAVVCQFGLMFFPDRPRGVAEAFRVLRPGGVFLFNVWDAIDCNVAVRIAHEAVTGFFPADPPRFYTVPFALCDPEPLVTLLTEAGFVGIEWVRVEKVGESPSAAEAAVGLIEGNPTGISERRPDALREVEAAVADLLRAELGDAPLRTPLSALVFTARRPD